MIQRLETAVPCFCLVLFQFTGAVILMKEGTNPPELTVLYRRSDNMNFPFNLQIRGDEKDYRYDLDKNNCGENNFNLVDKTKKYCGLSQTGDMIFEEVEPAVESLRNKSEKTASNWRLSFQKNRFPKTSAPTDQPEEYLMHVYDDGTSEVLNVKYTVIVTATPSEDYLTTFQLKLPPKFVFDERCAVIRECGTPGTYAAVIGRRDEQDHTINLLKINLTIPIFLSIFHGNPRQLKTKLEGYLLANDVNLPQCTYTFQLTEDINTDASERLTISSVSHNLKYDTLDKMQIHTLGNMRYYVEPEKYPISSLGMYQRREENRELILINSRGRIITLQDPDTKIYCKIQGVPKDAGTIQFYQKHTFSLLLRANGGDFRVNMKYEDHKPVFNDKLDVYFCDLKLATPHKVLLAKERVLHVHSEDHMEWRIVATIPEVVPADATPFVITTMASPDDDLVKKMASNKNDFTLLLYNDTEELPEFELKLESHQSKDKFLVKRQTLSGKSSETKVLGTKTVTSMAQNEPELRNKSRRF